MSKTLQIIGGRGIGKTYKLLEEADKNKGVVVCRNTFALREKARTYGFKNVQFLEYKDFVQNIESYPSDTDWYSEAIKGFKTPEEKTLYIDELEGLVKYICFNNLQGYTLSQEG